jgi:hypothetical protein
MAFRSADESVFAVFMVRDHASEAIFFTVVEETIHGPDSVEVVIMVIEDDLVFIFFDV